MRTLELSRPPAVGSDAGSAINEAVRAYWDNTLHDQAIARSPVGSPEFFQELDAYHFDKQRHLLNLIDFDDYRGKRVLDVGCGVGIDLARFARAGAIVTGVDLSSRSIDLARENFRQRRLSGDFQVMNAEHLQFSDSVFDFAFVHDVIHYAVSPSRIIYEVHRVLKPGGRALLQTYNRHSWLWLMARLGGVQLEHHDAPVFHVRSFREFKRLLQPFPDAVTFTERFPVRSQLHGSGIKGLVYNHVLVPAFQYLPRRLIGRFGWHSIALASKRCGGPV